MLVTVYKVNYPGLEKINEYYRWRLEWPVDDTVTDRAGVTKSRQNGPRLPCPGCGKQLSYSAVVTSGHQCPGTLTANPVKPGRPRMQLNKRQKERLFKDYVARQSHAITYSNE